MSWVNLSQVSPLTGGVSCRQWLLVVSQHSRLSALTCTCSRSCGAWIVFGSSLEKVARVAFSDISSVTPAKGATFAGCRVGALMACTGMQLCTYWLYAPSVRAYSFSHVPANQRFRRRSAL